MKWNNISPAIRGAIIGAMAGIAIISALDGLANLIHERALYRHQSQYYQMLLRECKQTKP